MNTSVKNILSSLEAFEKTSDSVGMELRLSLSEMILRTLRVKDWSQKKLADVSGLKEPYISRVLHSNENCTLDTIGRIFFAMGIRAYFQEKTMAGIFTTANFVRVSATGVYSDVHSGTKAITTNA